MKQIQCGGYNGENSRPKPGRGKYTGFRRGSLGRKEKGIEERSNGKGRKKLIPVNQSKRRIGQNRFWSKGETVKVYRAPSAEKGSVNQKGVA